MKINPYPLRSPEYQAFTRGRAARLAGRAPVCCRNRRLRRAYQRGYRCHVPNQNLVGR